MSAATIVSALRRERAKLAHRWLRQFAATRAAAAHPAIAVDDRIVLALTDDFTALLDPDLTLTGAHPANNAAALSRLAAFPENIAVTIDLLQAGVQVFGAFVVENAGPFAAWSVRDRNRFLGELDAVFPLLVRREVVALCERYFPDDAHHAADAAHEMIAMPDWARVIAHRN
jgi:hypothetical protein